MLTNERCACVLTTTTTLHSSVGYLCEFFSHHFEHTHNTAQKNFSNYENHLNRLVRLANFSTFDEVRRIFYNHTRKILIGAAKFQLINNINCIDPIR